MLIRNAEIDGAARGDVRIVESHVVSIGALTPEPGEPVIEGQGRALFPALHDHHIHLAAYAVSLSSLICGPPDIQTAEQLAERLADAADGGEGWMRGILYHESVGGELDRAILDRIVPDRPLRIQHRSGRLWIFNSQALALLKPEPGDPLERENGRLTGRLYDADDWLRTRIGGQFPSLREAGARLARYGVTAITDTTHTNGLGTLGHMLAAQREGSLPQQVLLMGDDSLNGAANKGDVLIGPRKYHLHDAALPDFDGLVASIRTAHRAERAVAFHCVTRTDLTFALAALEAAGPLAGDRIEHAAIAPPGLIALMRDLGVTVVTQPHFLAERGERYRAELPEDELAFLYRGRGFLDAGLALAGGSDAPFGGANPWASMDAATRRRAMDGAVLGEFEALTPEEAIGLYLGDLRRPGTRRRIEIGASGDLILLDRNWAEARQTLGAVQVALTLIAGEVIAAAGSF